MPLQPAATTVHWVMVSGVCPATYHQGRQAMKWTIQPNRPRVLTGRQSTAHVLQAKSTVVYQEVKKQGAWRSCACSGHCMPNRLCMPYCSCGLQSELYDARTMYAKAVAVREALEARTTRAEAEQAAAEGSLQQARSQVRETCPVG